MTSFAFALKCSTEVLQVWGAGLLAWHTIELCRMLSVFNTPTKCTYSKIHVLIITFSTTCFGAYWNIFRENFFMLKILLHFVITCTGMESFKINVSYVFCTPLQIMCFLSHNFQWPNCTFVEQKMKWPFKGQPWEMDDNRSVFMRWHGMAN
jgi:hypothetical protein